MIFTSKKKSVFESKCYSLKLKFLFSPDPGVEKKTQALTFSGLILNIHLQQDELLEKLISGKIFQFDPSFGPQSCCVGFSPQILGQVFFKTFYCTRALWIDKIFSHGFLDNVKRLPPLQNDNFSKCVI